MNNFKLIIERVGNGVIIYPSPDAHLIRSIKETRVFNSAYDINDYIRTWFKETDLLNCAQHSWSNGKDNIEFCVNCGVRKSDVV